MRSRDSEGLKPRLGAFIAVAALLLASCGTSNGASPAVTTPETSADTSSTSFAPQNEGAVTTLVGVRGAVIRIEATGSFDYPGEATQYNEGFTGSGFFISEDGIAVTNNHVVTGAAFLSVYVEGEDEPRNATILGVSECSDLAVIDVDGEGFPYLSWFAEELTAGMRVYAAGYPLGDAEYTLLDGIISKEKTDGESSWASVDAVLEHTADILPGNSGGPLVTEDGQVVGINYADNTEGQAFAIGYTEAISVIPRLRNGEDVASIGINGTAVSDSAGSGIWVHSVAAGSPADLVGVRGGDLVTELSGLIPGVDETMADYCEVLRSHQPGDAIQIEVLRDDTDEYLEGTLNTAKLLAPTGITADPGPDPGSTVSRDEYLLIVGDCVDDEEIENYLVGDDYSVTSCDGAHDNEVYYIYTYAVGPFPGDDVVADELEVACEAQFQDFVGRDYQSSTLMIGTVFPNEDLWDAGERSGECMVYSLDSEKLTGSAFQSGW
jgi:serine protease Do